MIWVKYISMTKNSCFEEWSEKQNIEAQKYGDKNQTY